MARNIGTCCGFEICLPTSGGKAGRGHNKTSTIQVRKDNCIVQQFRYQVDTLNRSSYNQAFDKARQWCEDNQGE